jgi:hypothetical protein
MEGKEVRLVLIGLLVLWATVMLDHAGTLGHGTSHGSPRRRSESLFHVGKYRIRRARRGERLRRLEFAIAAPAESFYVADTSGPLVPDELDRAKRWGENLASELEVSAHERTST